MSSKPATLISAPNRILRYIERTSDGRGWKVADPDNLLPGLLYIPDDRMREILDVDRQFRSGTIPASTPIPVDHQNVIDAFNRDVHAEKFCSVDVAGDLVIPAVPVSDDIFFPTDKAVTDLGHTLSNTSLDPTIVAPTPPIAPAAIPAVQTAVPDVNMNAVTPDPIPPVPNADPAIRSTPSSQIRNERRFERFNRRMNYVAGQRQARRVRFMDEPDADPNSPFKALLTPENGAVLVHMFLKSARKDMLISNDIQRRRRFRMMQQQQQSALTASMGMEF
ncbi:hypothetical protein VNI00_006696 [Paramarasmius palmivorus]|uniref:Uncharacterized protein n=1 Tax=Paramarasmius palmivorus TaxID=297713 RepID=A0AAW0D8I5_9AGAR